MAKIKQPTFKFVLREDLKDNKEFLPTRAEGKASGWDVRAAQQTKQPITLRPFDNILIPLGFKAFCPDGWWFELKPRSSTFAKKHLHSLYGTIDEAYEGQAMFACQYIPPAEYLPKYLSILSNIPFFNYPKTLTINFGDPIGQIIPIKRQEMEVIEVSQADYTSLCENRNGERKDGGFGSSDTKTGFIKYGQNKAPNNS